MLPVPHQPELFPEGELPEGAELLMTEQQQRALYPLTTVEKNAKRLEAIQFLLARNAPRSFICRTLGVGWHTLQAIAVARGDKIADIKKRSAAKAAMFVELGLEHLLEELQAGRLDADKLGVTIGILVDKVQLLTGDSTVIVGQAGDQGPRLTVDGLRAKLAEMKGSAVDGELVDVGTGSAAQTIPQTRAAAPAGAQDPAVSDYSSDQNAP